MKILVGTLITLMLVGAGFAQDTRVIAELSASTEKIVKGSPFSAEAVSESIQVLPDGNRIVRSSTTKLHRNGEGRFRRDNGTGANSLFGSVYTFGSGVTILDPVIGYKYQLDTDLKVAHQDVLRPFYESKILTTAPTAAMTVLEKAMTVERLQGQLKPTMQAATAASDARAAVTTTVKPALAGMAAPMALIAKNRYETRTDDLGVQNVEGVEAEGKRTTTTIPAGAIGNERPIEIVYEKWYAKDLELVVMSKHYDPRFGEQTYRLTNIQRSEPDPSLFSLPTGFKIISQGTSPSKAAAAARADMERTVYTRSVTPVTITPVKHKP